MKRKKTSWGIIVAIFATIAFWIYVGYDLPIALFGKDYIDLFYTFYVWPIVKFVFFFVLILLLADRWSYLCKRRDIEKGG